MAFAQCLEGGQHPNCGCSHHRFIVRSVRVSYLGPFNDREKLYSISNAGHPEEACRASLNDMSASDPDAMSPASAFTN